MNLVATRRTATFVLLAVVFGLLAGLAAVAGLLAPAGIFVGGFVVGPLLVWGLPSQEFS